MMPQSQKKWTRVVGLIPSVSLRNDWELPVINIPRNVNIITGRGLDSVVISHLRNMPVVSLGAHWQWHYDATYSSWPCST
jgi:hypothetical protein